MHVRSVEDEVESPPQASNVRVDDHRLAHDLQNDLDQPLAPVDLLLGRGPAKGERGLLEGVVGWFGGQGGKGEGRLRSDGFEDHVNQAVILRRRKGGRARASVV